MGVWALRLAPGAALVAPLAWCCAVMFYSRRYFCGPVSIVSMLNLWGDILHGDDHMVGGYIEVRQGERGLRQIGSADGCERDRRRGGNQNLCGFGLRRVGGCHLHVVMRQRPVIPLAQGSKGDSLKSERMPLVHGLAIVQHRLQLALLLGREHLAHGK